MIGDPTSEQAADCRTHKSPWPWGYASSQCRADFCCDCGRADPDSRPAYSSAETAPRNLAFKKIHCGTGAIECQRGKCARRARFSQSIGASATQSRFGAGCQDVVRGRGGGAPCGILRNFFRAGSLIDRGMNRAAQGALGSSTYRCFDELFRHASPRTAALR